jgi:hypothetical protein
MWIFVLWRDLWWWMLYYRSLDLFIATPRLFLELKKKKNFHPIQMLRSSTNENTQPIIEQQLPQNYISMPVLATRHNFPTPVHHLTRALTPKICESVSLWNSRPIHPTCFLLGELCLYSIRMLLKANFTLLQDLICFRRRVNELHLSLWGRQRPHGI